MVALAYKDPSCFCFTMATLVEAQAFTRQWAEEVGFGTTPGGSQVCPNGHSEGWKPQWREMGRCFLGGTSLVALCLRYHTMFGDVVLKKKKKQWFLHVFYFERPWKTKVYVSVFCLHFFFSSEYIECLRSFAEFAGSWVDYRWWLGVVSKGIELGLMNLFPLNKTALFLQQESISSIHLLLSSLPLRLVGLQPATSGCATLKHSLLWKKHVKTIFF